MLEWTAIAKERNLKQISFITYVETRSAWPPLVESEATLKQSEALGCLLLYIVGFVCNLYIVYNSPDAIKSNYVILSIIF